MGCATLTHKQKSKATELKLPCIYRQLIESIEKLPLALQAVAARAQYLLGFARERLSPEVFARLQSAVADFENDPSALTSRIGGVAVKGTVRIGQHRILGARTADHSFLCLLPAAGYE